MAFNQGGPFCCELLEVLAFRFIAVVVALVIVVVYGM
jgi:hypothetical protein